MTGLVPPVPAAEVQAVLAILFYMTGIAVSMAVSEADAGAAKGGIVITLCSPFLSDHQGRYRVLQLLREVFMVS